MTGYYAVVSKSAVDFFRGGQGEGEGVEEIFNVIVLHF